MASPRNIDQIFIANPVTTIGDTDVLYLAVGGATDGAISGASLKAQFLLPTPVPLGSGGTSAALTANNGGLVYSNATTLAILAGTATARQIPLSGATGAPTWSTATYPSTIAANQLLYANATNTITGIAAPTIQGQVLISNISGVAGWSSLQFPTGGIGNNSILISGSSNNFNSVAALSNTILTCSPIGILGFETPGTSITLNNSGNLSVTNPLPNTITLQGVIAGASAGAGIVGELIQNVVASGSAVSFTSNTPANITSISLTAGDWDVWGNVALALSGVTTVQGGWTSASSATQPDISLLSLIQQNSGTVAIPVPMMVKNVSTTTTIFLSGVASFTTGTCLASGGIYARRRR